MVSTTTVRPYSAARRAIAAAVVVLPTPPAPQHTTTRLAVSDRMAPMSSAGGVVLTILLLGSSRKRSSHALVGEFLGEFVEAAQVDAVAQRGQFESRDVELVELFGALGARRNARRMLDGLGEKAGEIVVGQRYSRLRQARPDTVGVHDALRGLGQVRRGEVVRNVPVDDHAADRQPEFSELVDRLDGLLNGKRLQQGDQVDRRQLGVQNLHHAFGLTVYRTALGQIGDGLGDVEEAGDPPGRRGVDHDGVVCRLLALLGPRDDLADLAREQHVPQSRGNRRRALDLLVRQRRHVEELGDALAALDFDQQHLAAACREGQRQRRRDRRLSGASLAGHEVQAHLGEAGWPSHRRSAWRCGRLGSHLSMLAKCWERADRLSHMSEPTKWEYVTVPLLVHVTKQILDQWGDQGYELVTVLPGPTGEQHIAYLKRPK